MRNLQEQVKKAFCYKKFSNSRLIQNNLVNKIPFLNWPKNNKLKIQDSLKYVMCTYIDHARYWFHVHFFNNFQRGWSATSIINSNWWRISISSNSHSLKIIQKYIAYIYVIWSGIGSNHFVGGQTFINRKSTTDNYAIFCSLLWGKCF